MHALPIAGSVAVGAGRPWPGAVGHVVNSENKPVDEALIRHLQFVIRSCVRALAILMVFVIVMGVVDVGWTIWQMLISPPRFIMTISDILLTFGAFMVVLIAIEIFVNVRIYLRDDIFHVKIVIDTALMAVARKVIVLDMEKTEPLAVLALAGLVVASGVCYWLVHRTAGRSLRIGQDDSNGDPPARPGANAAG